MSSKKVIAVGDFIKARDSVINVAIPDPENVGGTIEIPLRIRKPTPKDSIKIMEFVNTQLGDKMELLEQAENLMTLEPEKRNEAINLAYRYDATLISSSVYFPPADGNLSVMTEKVFATADEVLDRCPVDLFNALRLIVGRERVIVTEGEAKK